MNPEQLEQIRLTQERETILKRLGQIDLELLEAAGNTVQIISDLKDAGKKGKVEILDKGEIQAYKTNLLQSEQLTLLKRLAVVETTLGIKPK
jgi:hypothetical protein